MVSSLMLLHLQQVRLLVLLVLVVILVQFFSVSDFDNLTIRMHSR